MQRITLYPLALMLCASLSACAQAKKAGSTGSGLQILEATQQSTKPGRMEMQPFTQYRFRVIWKNRTPPQEFHWRPDAKSWMETGVAKPEKRPGLAPGDFMILERNIEMKNIRYGDTLIITTRRHAHDEEPMPAAVKKMPVSSIYYQVSGKWQYTKVNTRKLPDIVAP